MKSKSKVSKNQKQLLMYILFIAIGIIIGISSTIAVQTLTSNKESKEVKENQKSKKESPYTLDEIYALIENPEEFNLKNNLFYNDLAYTIIHFYDYFSETTPMKVATEIIRDDSGTLREVKETKYISYHEFMEFTQQALYQEKENQKICQENNISEKDCFYEYPTDYKYWTNLLVFGRFLNNE